MGTGAAIRFVRGVYQINQGLLLDQDFGDVFQNSYRSPLTDAFVVKLRYRLALPSPL